MKQSQLFTKTIKDAPKDETSRNAQLLIRAGFVDKVFAGVYNILPLGLRVLYKIETIIREEINAIGGQEVLLPALHPLENYEKTGREAIDILFFTEMRDGKKLTLAPSQEEIITPLMQKYIRSHKDLPKAVYQFQNKFRNELRAKSGIMRGREFRMKDLYSFHASQEDFDVYYENAMVAYSRIFDRLGISAIKTYASGGTFSKYSHEYQTVTDSGEDTIYTCTDCSVAINKEIVEDLNSTCPECKKGDLKEQKSIEVGNIFPLATKFSKAFDFTYTDTDGKQQPIIMGCYGIGVTRTLGTIAEIYNDEKGLTWPESVAPFAVHLVSLCKDEEDVKKADKLYADFQAAGVEVLYDERDARPGEKFADSDLIGIPVRVVISPRTIEKNEVEVKNRRSGEETHIPLKDILTTVV
jgi:prolyl-tRNA synthetase